jgi:hypothetical protein
MSTYETAPGTVPMKIVPYSSRRSPDGPMAPPPAGVDLPVSYEELIQNAAIDTALEGEAL